MERIVTIKYDYDDQSDDQLQERRFKVLDNLSVNLHSPYCEKFCVELMAIIAEQNRREKAKQTGEGTAHFQFTPRGLQPVEEPVKTAKETVQEFLENPEVKEKLNRLMEVSK